MTPDAEKEPEYRDVVIKADQKVKDFYDVEERLGTWVNGSRVTFVL